MKNKIEKLKRTILDLLPEEGWGQLPFIVYHQARRRLEEEITWGDMQFAFNSLYQDSRIYPQQEFSKSITKRAYRFKL